VGDPKIVIRMRDRYPSVINLSIFSLTCWFSKIERTDFWYAILVLERRKKRKDEDQRTSRAGCLSVLS
jgi:hypothetical protein